MATDERELTEPVDLCLPDGRLNPAATGWSRVPLHRGNLRGVWGRRKRWDYWAVLAGDLVVSAVYADIDYLGLSDVWWCDLSTGRTGGVGTNRPLAFGIDLPEQPGTTPLRLTRGPLHLTISDDEAGTRLRGHWVEPARSGGEGGEMARLDVTVALPEGHESLNVVVPWSERTYQYTSKHQARPAVGELVVGDRRWEIGRPATDGGTGDAWGVLDVGRGRWPYATRWNWGGGAGRATSGEVVGIQLGGMWTVGTGATENGILVDGRLTKIGEELEWSYSWDAPLRSWRVRGGEAAGGRPAVDLVLAPRHDKHTKVDALVLRTETHQVFGTWSGTVVPDDGEPRTLEGIQGFAEESRSRW